MVESFGTRLRQQRERQQVALAAIARETKISLSLLEGLERDDLSHWPAGIFRRSFFRAYARMIGLESDIVVREFLELYPDPVEEAAPVRPITDGEPTGERPPTRLQCLIASTIGSLTRVQPQVVRERESVAEALRAAHPVPGFATPQPAPDLAAAADLCTQLARATDVRAVGPLLEGAAKLLSAAGVIVWVWDPQLTGLKPILAYGYPEELLAQLPIVQRDAENATARSFRSAQRHIVNGRDLASGAVVAPLLTAMGCVGVLAVELRNGGEQQEPVRALVTIFAALIGTCLAFMPLADAVNA